MRPLLFSCTAWCALGIALPAAAQPLLTEAEAVARVSLESPRVSAIRVQADLARADRLAASRWPNPGVTITRESVGGVAENYLLLSQTLPLTGRRRLEVDSARAAEAAAGIRAEDLVRRVRADARRAFVDLSAGQMRVRDLEAAVNDLQAVAAVLVSREAAGDAAGFDRLRAQREVLDLRASLGDARTEVALAQGTLAAFFFPAPDPADLHAAPLSAERTPIPDADDLVARAEASRPELQALGRDAEAARLAGAAAARSRIPEPELLAGLKTASTSADRQGSVFSLAAAIPLFDRARPERTRARIHEQIATAARDALRSEIAATVRALHRAVAERRATADEFRKTSLRVSDELRRIAVVSYDAGERTILELLDAWRTASDARARLTALEAATAHAEIDLELAAAVEIRR